MADHRKPYGSDDSVLSPLGNRLEPTKFEIFLHLALFFLFCCSPRIYWFSFLMFFSQIVDEATLWEGLHTIVSPITWLWRLLEPWLANKKLINCRVARSRSARPAYNWRYNWGGTVQTCPFWGPNQWYPQPHPSLIGSWIKKVQNSNLFRLHEFTVSYTSIPYESNIDFIKLLPKINART